MSELTKIELTPEEVQLFLQFKEHQDMFQSLMRGKVFELKACKAILHIDGNGSVRRITTEVTTYREDKLARLDK